MKKTIEAGAVHYNPTPSDHLVISHKRQAERYKKELISSLNYVVREAQNAIWVLEQGHGQVNSLGILQRSGQDVDRLAALYMKQTEIARELENFFEKKEGE